MAGQLTASAVWKATIGGGGQSIVDGRRLG